MGWKPTPEENRMIAELIDGSRVTFDKLKVGDIVRLITPDGVYVDPLDHTIQTDKVYARIKAPAEKANTVPEIAQHDGYGIEIERGPLSDFLS